MLKLLAIFSILLPFGCANSPVASQAPARTGSKAQQTAGTVPGDPESLIHHCGKPDHTSENDFFQEGASVSIQSRSLTYGKAHLSFTYVASGQGWGFSNLVDTQTNHALDTADAQSILRQRLPCAVSEVGSSEDARNGSQETRSRSRKSESGNQKPEGRRG